MRYYVVSDIHGFHSPLIAALNHAGFFSDQQPRKLIVLGDLFDRGKEAKELEAFALPLYAGTSLRENEEAVVISVGADDSICSP